MGREEHLQPGTEKMTDKTIEIKRRGIELQKLCGELSKINSQINERWHAKSTLNALHRRRQELIQKKSSLELALLELKASPGKGDAMHKNMERRYERVFMQVVRENVSPKVYDILHEETRQRFEAGHGLENV